MDEPKTARAAMMIDHDQMRTEARIRLIVLSSVRRAFDENWDRSNIEDAHDAERSAMRCAEMAAYYAVEKERELHAGDLATLKVWMEARAAEDMLMPRSFVVPKDAK